MHFDTGAITALVSIGIDQATVIGAVAGSTVRVALRFFRGQRLFRTQACIVDLLNGATAVPFLYLALAVFQESMYKDVVASKGLLAMAGLVGLIFCLGQLMGHDKNDEPRKAATESPPPSRFTATHPSEG